MLSAGYRLVYQILLAHCEQPPLRQNWRRLLPAEGKKIEPECKHIEVRLAVEHRFPLKSTGNKGGIRYPYPLG